MFKRPNPAGALADRLKKVAENKAALLGVEKPQAFAPKRSQRAERQAMFRNAALVFANHKVTVAITNMSQTGARVEFQNQPELPERVTLIALGFKREAKVVWLKQGAAGLRFLD